MKALTTRLWIITVITSILLITSVFAQNPSLVENGETSKVLSSISDVKKFRNDETAISVFKAMFNSDLIPNSESHELYTRLYVVVSQTGEEPLNKVYVIKGLVNVNKLSFRELDKFTVIVEFMEGPYDKRKAHVYKIDSRNLTIKSL